MQRDRAFSFWKPSREPRLGSRDVGEVFPSLCLSMFLTVRLFETKRGGKKGPEVVGKESKVTVGFSGTLGQTGNRK